MFGGAGIIALIVIILLVSIFSGGRGVDNYALYLKDREIYYTDFTREGVKEITTRLLNDNSISASDMAYEGSSLGSFIAFSKDGNRIFFPDRLDGSSDGFTLYCRDINKPEEEPVKIDSDMMKYAINDAGDQVVYIKGSDGVLYRHDLTDKEKIASGVDNFDVTDDCKKIAYHKEDSSFHLWYADKDSIKLASDISRIEHVSDDLSVIYYIKDGSLYKQVEGNEDKEKIDSDVSRVVKVFDSGEVYYTKAESAQMSLLDYVNDDMAATDAALTEPEYPNYPSYPIAPSWWDYDSEEEYDAAKAQYETDYAAYEATCNQMTAEYDEANNAYWAKCERDSLRESLQSSTMETTGYTLYYFNGTEKAVVTDALVNEWDLSYAHDKAVITLQIYNQSEVKKVKLSEISNYNEVSDMVNAALYSSSEKYIAIGTALSVVTQTDAVNFMVSADGSTVYFLDDISEDRYGDLYKITITDAQVGAPKMFDSDVRQYAISFAKDDKVSYYKNVSDDNFKGDLYIDKIAIDYDVRLYAVSYLGDAVLYYTDWNEDKHFGTLKMFKNGTKTKVSDDVHDFTITNDEDILYLYDYSTNYYNGTLYLYNNGDPKKIDDDVICLIPIYDNAIKGTEYYSW